MKTTNPNQWTRDRIRQAWLKNHVAIEEVFLREGFSAGLVERLGCDLYEGRYPFELAYLETGEHRLLLVDLLSQ